MAQEGPSLQESSFYDEEFEPYGGSDDASYLREEMESSEGGSFSYAGETDASGPSPDHTLTQGDVDVLRTSIAELWAPREALHEGDEVSS